MASAYTGSWAGGRALEGHRHWHGTSSRPRTRAGCTHPQQQRQQQRQPPQQPQRQQKAIPYPSTKGLPTGGCTQMRSCCSSPTSGASSRKVSTEPCQGVKKEKKKVISFFLFKRALVLVVERDPVQAIPSIERSGSNACPGARRQAAAFEQAAGTDCTAQCLLALPQTTTQPSLPATRPPPPPAHARTWPK